VGRIKKKSSGAKKEKVDLIKTGLVEEGKKKGKLGRLTWV